MNILLIGGSGQVGSELNEHLSKKYSVYSFPSSEFDLRDLSNIEETFMNLRPDFVINAAAYTNVRSAEQNIALARSINFKGVENLAKACREFSTPLCHLSTDYVFKGEQNNDYMENDLTQPINVYGSSKLEGEETIRSLLNDYLIIRTSWVFGNGKNFVKTILESAKNKKELSVINDQYGGPTSSRAIALCIGKLTDQFFSTKKMIWGTYHFCGQPKTSWYDFAEEICMQAKKAGIIDFQPIVNSINSESFQDQVKRPKNSYLSCRKIYENFGIEQPDWKIELKAYLDNLIRAKNLN
jgi:dTDP-4-dehydrorhamnose reductase